MDDRQCKERVAKLERLIHEETLALYADQEDRQQGMTLAVLEARERYHNAKIAEWERELAAVKAECAGELLVEPDPPVGTEINAYSPLVSREDEELAQLDLQILKQLFRHINYDNVNQLLQGYADGRVLVDAVAEFDYYFSMRQHPDFKLYDPELESMLSEFDVAVNDTLSVGGLLFGLPTNNGSYTYYTASYTEPWAKASAGRKELDEHTEFVEQHVRPTMKKYTAFIDKLRSRRLYHKLGAWTS